MIECLKGGEIRFLPRHLLRVGDLRGPTSVFEEKEAIEISRLQEEENEKAMRDFAERGREIGEERRA